MLAYLIEDSCLYWAYNNVQETNSMWGKDALWETSDSRERITGNTLHGEGAIEAMSKQSKETGL